MKVCKKHGNYGPFPCAGCEIDELTTRLAEAKEHKCECGIPRDPNELCEVRCHLLNLLPEDPRDNEHMRAVELVEKLIKSERIT